MAYADRNASGSRVVALVIVGLLHVALGYAFVTGLAYQYVKKVSEKLNTFDVEPPPPPPPDEPPPPPSASPSSRSATGSPRCSGRRSEEHTSELQSLMRISYAVFCLKQKKTHILHRRHNHTPY